MKRLALFLFWFEIALFSAGLCLYAWLGFYNRFWADDWCYNADWKTLGFWGTLQGYTFITHYASNRYSLTLFTLLMQRWGIFSAQITAVLVVALWFGGLFLIMRGINQLFRLKLRPVIIVFVTGAIEFYSLCFAPNQFRSLYFRSSVLTYTTPLIFAFYVFGLLLWQMNREKPARALVLSIAPLSFLAAGFSEGGCAYLGAAVGILWVVVFIYQKRGYLWAQRIFIPLTMAMVSIVVAMFILVLSPANAPRHAGYPIPTNPLLLPWLSVKNSIAFIWSSVHDLILPHAVFGLLFLVLPFLVSLTEENLINMPFAKGMLAIFVIAVCAVLLIAACQIPAIYIEGGPPASKALISARFTLLFAFAAIFWIAGSWLATHLSGNYRYGMALLILVSFLYPIRPILLTYLELPRFSERAIVWDARDRSIRNAQEQGILEIDVKGIDSRYMGQTLDFKERPNFWVNGCAEIYYNVQEIRATLP